MEGLIHIYTGDGKGKTTAAVGLTVRAIGNGLKVLFVQFIKGSQTGEVEFLSKFQELVEIYRCSTGFVFKSPDELQRQKVKDCLREIEEKIKKNTYDLIILDEFSVAISTGLITKEEAERLIEIKPKSSELIITGRGAPEWLIEKADLVTEMRKIKHYFDRGIQARRGIEY
jgi:cob(I)alamin adenosyltransferase